MPFTPLHLGPGLAFKAIGGRHLSFMVFGGSQVMMDIEPLLGIVNGWPVLHGWTHTFAIAVPIGVLAGAIGKPIGELALRLLKIEDPHITWTASFVGGLVGTLSHVALDAIMHADAEPLRPFAAGNPFLSWVSLDTLHLACLVLGVCGGLVVAARGLWPKRKAAR